MRDLGDRGGEHSRHAGVHGVTTATEHPHPGLGREVSPGCDDTNSADDFGSVGRCAAGGFLAPRVPIQAERGKGGEEHADDTKKRPCSHGA